MKYDFYSYTNKDGKRVVCAVSRYAGHKIRATAVCNPNDEYNEDKGQLLAMARCNAKIAGKRMSRAAQRLDEAAAAVDAAVARYNKLEKSFNSVSLAYSEADNEVKCLLREM